MRFEQHPEELREERERSAAEVRFGVAFENSAHPMLVADDQMRYVEANGAACLFLRMPRSQIIGRHVSEFAPPGAQGRLRELWARLVSQGHLAGQWRLQLEDGTSRLVHFVATANVVPGLHLVILSDEEQEYESVGQDGDSQNPTGQSLTAREREVLRLVALGGNQEQIASELYLSPETIRTHLRNARRKLGALNRAHAVALALKRGEIQL